MRTSKASSPNGRLRALSRFARLHRWLGLTSIAFVVLLSVTGIALNHTADLGLDRRYIEADWLLDWYGIDAPPAAASFAVGGRRLTLVGNRLYLDEREVERDVAALVGAAELDGRIVVASDVALTFFSAVGERLDRIELAPAPAVRGPAVSQGRLILSLGQALYVYDEQTLGIAPLAGDADSLDWPRASPVPAALIERIERAYRGDGVTVERFLYDLHSGRLLTSAGVWLMDLVGALLILLAGTGLYLWLKR